MYQQSLNEVSFAILLHESHGSYPSRRRACFLEAKASLGSLEVKVKAKSKVKLSKTCEIVNEYLNLCLVCNYASMHVLCMQVSRYSGIQVCKYASIQVCKNEV